MHEHQAWPAAGATLADVGGEEVGGEEVGGEEVGGGSPLEQPGSTGAKREQARRSWLSWAYAVVTPDPARAEAAAEHALQALEQGATPEMAAGFAALGAGGSAHAFLPEALRQRATAETVLSELDQARRQVPEGDSGAIERLGGLFRQRIAACDRLLELTASPAVPAAPPALPTPYPAGIPIGAPAGPQLPDTDGGIQLLAYTGAFLLVVATILFEAYAVPHKDQLPRLAVLAGADLLFAAGARALRRTARLASVGNVYLGVAALVFPLVLAGAAMALHAGTTGMSPAAALAAGAAACTVLYGGLGLVMRSRAYAALGSFALAVGWASGLYAIHAGLWGGAGFAPIVVLYAAMSGRSDGGEAQRDGGEAQRDRGAAQGRAPAHSGVNLSRSGVLRPLAEPFAYLSAIAAVTWAIPATAPRAVTIVVVTLELAAICWYYRRGHLAWAVAAGVSSSVLASSAALHGGLVAIGSELALLAVAFAWVSSLPGSSPLFARMAWPSSETARSQHDLRVFLRVGATVQALATILAFQPRPWWMEAAVLVVAAAAPALVAIRAKQPNWLFASSLLVAGAWIFLARGAQAAGLDLHIRLGSGAGSIFSHMSAIAAVHAYLPLGFLLIAAGLAVSRRAGPSWALPPYVTGAWITFFVVLYALEHHHFLLAGGVFLGAAALAELAAAVEGNALLAWPATLLLGAGAACFARAASSPPYDYPLAVAAACVLGYLAGVFRALAGSSASGAWGQAADHAGAHAGAHRFAATGTLAALATVLLLYRGTWHGSWARPDDGMLVAVLAVLVLLSAMLAEERWEGGPWWMPWASPLVASLAGIPLARLAGATDPQWYVLGPGLGLLATGLALPRSASGAARDVLLSRVLVGRWLAGTGFVLLAGTSAVQMLEGSSLGAASLPPGMAVALLVAEGVVSILCGIVLRRRVPIVGGAVATAVAAFWALAAVARQVPLYAFFAATGVLLLAGATMLVASRRRLGTLRRSLQTSWSDWR